VFPFWHKAAGFDPKEVREALAEAHLGGFSSHV